MVGRTTCLANNPGRTVGFTSSGWQCSCRNTGNQAADINPAIRAYKTTAAFLIRQVAIPEGAREYAGRKRDQRRSTQDAEIDPVQGQVYFLKALTYRVMVEPNDSDIKKRKCVCEVGRPLLQEFLC